jgi:predicted kinase
MDTREMLADVQSLKQNIKEIPESVDRAAFIVVSGLPGVGKSYFSRKLAERLHSVIVETDAMRKQLFAIPTYGRTENKRLFDACHRLTEDLLRSGVTVIFDATNLYEKHREYLYNIAQRSKAKLIIVQVEAPAKTVVERLRNRSREDDPDDSSEADWEIHRAMKTRAERIRRKYFAVDTSRDIDPIIRKIIRIIKE